MAEKRDFGGEMSVEFWCSCLVHVFMLMKWKLLWTVYIRVVAHEMGYNIGAKFFQKNEFEKSYDQKTEFSGDVRLSVCVLEIVIHGSCSELGRIRIQFEDIFFHNVKLTIESEYSFHFTARAHCSFHFVCQVRTGFRCTGELRSPCSWNNKIFQGIRKKYCPSHASTRTWFVRPFVVYGGSKI